MHLDIGIGVEDMQFMLAAEMVADKNLFVEPTCSET